MESERRGKAIGPETKHLNRLAGCKLKSHSERVPLWGAKVLLGQGLRPWREVRGQKSWRTDALGEGGEGRERRGGVGLGCPLFSSETHRGDFVT